MPHRVHVKDILSVSYSPHNSISCSFKTKFTGIKEGKILFMRFKAGNQNLIVGRISPKVNAGR